MKKTTILLLICSLGVMGQTMEPLNIDSSNIQFALALNPEYIIIDATPENTKEKDEWKMGESVPLGLFLVYEQECYNDSIFVKSFDNSVLRIKAVNGSIDLTQPTWTDAVCRIKEEWIHTEPTFKGFITWLKTKYKIN